LADEKRTRRTRRSQKEEPGGAASPAGQAAEAGAGGAERPHEGTGTSASPTGGRSAAPGAQEKPTSTPGGTLEFDPGIITEIAVREASGIEGVAELTGGWRTKGVQVGESTEGGEEGYILDLRIAVEYGVNCVALAETIRNRIANAIEQMTGRRTTAINIHVTGIREKGTREEHHEEGTPLGEEHGIDF